MVDVHQRERRRTISVAAAACRQTVDMLEHLDVGAIGPETANELYRCWDHLLSGSGALSGRRDFG